MQANRCESLTASTCQVKKKKKRRRFDVTEKDLSPNGRREDRNQREKMKRTEPSPRPGLVEERKTRPAQYASQAPAFLQNKSIKVCNNDKRRMNTQLDVELDVKARLAEMLIQPRSVWV